MIDKFAAENPANTLEINSVATLQAVCTEAVHDF